MRMEGSNKLFRLLEVIFARAVTFKVENSHSKICCGWKQDRFVVNEHERWQVHGLVNIEKIDIQNLIWNEFTGITGILNTEVYKNFPEHFIAKIFDKKLVEALLLICQDEANHQIVRMHDLST